MDLPHEVQRLRLEGRILEQRLELDSSGSFYLLVDPPNRTMRLMLQGAVLQDYELLLVEVGEARLFFVSPNVQDDWWGKTWESGRLEPPRVRDRFRLQVQVGGQDGDPPEIPIPPLPESSPVPDRYLIRYADGMSLEVRYDKATGAGAGWSRAFQRWLADAGAALRTRSRDRLRLRILLRREDAEAFYRALPSDTRLLVLPPTS